MTRVPHPCRDQSYAPCAFYGLSPEDVIRHYDVTGKLCPRYYVEHPGAWEAFQKALAEEDTSATFFMRYSLEAQIKTRTTLGVLPQHMAGGGSGAEVGGRRRPLTPLFVKNALSILNPG